MFVCNGFSSSLIRLCRSCEKFHIDSILYSCLLHLHLQLFCILCCIVCSCTGNKWGSKFPGCMGRCHVCRHWEDNEAVQWQFSFTSESGGPLCYLSPATPVTIASMYPRAFQKLPPSHTTRVHSPCGLTRLIDGAFRADVIVWSMAAIGSVQTMKPSFSRLVTYHNTPFRKPQCVLVPRSLSRCNLV